MTPLKLFPDERNKPIINQLAYICYWATIKCILSLQYDFTIRKLNESNQGTVKLFGHVYYFVVLYVVGLSNFGLIDVKELMQAEKSLIQCTVVIEYEGKTPHFKGIFQFEIVKRGQSIVEYGHIIPVYLVLCLVKRRVPLANGYCLII